MRQTDVEKGIDEGVKRALKVVQFEIEAATKDLGGRTEASVHERAMIRLETARNLARDINRVSRTPLKSAPTERQNDLKAAI